MKLGVVCSAGGSAFFAAYDIALRAGVLAPGDVVLVTDRPCGAEAGAADRGLACHRIVETDAAAFSQRAARLFQAEGCDLAVLLFTRLVTAGLHAALPVLNVHPSLLPALPGFGALQAAVRLGLPMTGATLHLATDAADGGPIIAQVAAPSPRPVSVDRLARLSFVQKTYLILVAIDLASRGLLRINPACATVDLPAGLRVSASAAPALQTPALVAAFAAFLSGRDDDAGVLQP